MSLRVKLLGLLGLVLVLHLSVTWAVQSWVVTPSFSELERTEVRTDLHRCLDAIDRDLASIDAVAGDYGAWDDAAAFLNDGNEKFIRDNLSPANFATLKLDVIGYLDKTGRGVWLQARNGDEVLNLAVLPATGLPPEHPLLQLKSPDSSVRGLMMTDYGPLLIVSRAITNGDHQPPIHGAVIMGRFLDDDDVADLEHVTKVNMRVLPLASPLLTANEREIVAHLEATGQDELRPDGSVMRAYALLHDVDGRPAALLNADVPRLIMDRGKQAAVSAKNAALGGAVVILGILWVLLNHGVVRPLRQLTEHVIHVGARDDLAARINLARADEIGTLAGAFNRMAALLAESRTRLVDTAHHAGMAEIATEVLHNVGNAINNIGISAHTVEERIAPAPAGLKETIAALEQHREDLPRYLADGQRGEKLVNYLSQFEQSLNHCHDDVRSSVQSLRLRVEDVKAIITAQQQHATCPGFTQVESLSRVVESGLRMAGLAESQQDLEVVRQFADLPPMPLEKSRLMQVVANLAHNALEAMAGKGERRLVIRTGRRGPTRVFVSLENNGAGIESSIQHRIFGFGFTTKTEGHGYGLHYCANTVRQMGGIISFQSDGRGHGATFTIELPVPGEGASA